MTINSWAKKLKLKYIFFSHKILTYIQQQYQKCIRFNNQHVGSNANAPPLLCYSQTYRLTSTSKLTLHARIVHEPLCLQESGYKKAAERARCAL